MKGTDVTSLVTCFPLANLPRLQHKSSVKMALCNSVSPEAITIMFDNILIKLWKIQIICRALRLRRWEILWFMPYPMLNNSNFDNLEDKCHISEKFLYPDEAG